MRYRFATCLLDTDAHRLEVDGTPVPVEPQVFAILRLLAGNPGTILTRDRLVDEIWGGRIVSEATIAARIAAARRAVGDSGARQEIIETLTKVGIRMAAGVSTEGPARPAPAERPPIRYATSADGTRIATVTHGTGPPLLRGGHWLGHLELDWESPVWRPLLDRLGQSFTLTRYDQRGTGLSDRDPRAATVDRLAEDMAAVADAAGLDRFPIFAASQAVPTAIRFAVRWPERVSALILYGGFALGRHHRQTPEERAREEATLTLIREGWGRTGTAFIRAFSMIYTPGCTTAQLDDMTRMQLASADPETVVRLREAIDRLDVTADLAEVRAPTLVIHARGDAVHPASQGQYLASRIPGATFRMIESDSHVMLPQDPAWTEALEEAIRFAGG